MSLQTHSHVDVPYDLIEAIRAFPREREVEHCGVKFTVSPFDFYATCPQCGCQIKLRSFSAHYEMEDVFDAVFELMNHAGAEELARRRQQALEEEADE